MWMLHYEAGVTICDDWSELLPIQERFLTLCMKEYLPSKKDIPSEAR